MTKMQPQQLLILITLFRIFPNPNLLLFLSAVNDPQKFWGFSFGN
jgi:hypothetical protein